MSGHVDVRACRCQGMQMSGHADVRACRCTGIYWLIHLYLCGFAPIVNGHIRIFYVLYSTDNLPKCVLWSTIKANVNCIAVEKKILFYAV